MDNPSAGDMVKVIRKDHSEISGIMIPTPALTGEDCIILKLKNGYNIGISNKDIEKIDVIEKYSPKPVKPHPVAEKKDLPTVSIISTGGTISSRVDYRTGGVYADYTAKDFVEMCPELKDVANIKARKAFSMMSEDMTPKDWQMIASEIVQEIKTGVSGVVVTHGTDTLHFTAAALSFFLEELPVPVLLIGSQRSIDRGSSDAFMNLLCAVKAAAQCDAAEVMTCLHGSTDDEHCLLIRGTKVRKMHTSRRDAFRPVNDVPIAKVFPGGNIEYIGKNYRKRNTGAVKLKSGFESKVAIINVYPGMDPGIFDYYIGKGYKGLVVAATALGHVPTFSENSPLAHIKKAHDLGIPVIIATQTIYGRVNPFVYTNLRKLSIEAKAIYADDMMPEVAYVKLGWVLAQTTEYEKVKELMLKNVRGEFNPSLTDEMFMN